LVASVTSTWPRSLTDGLSIGPRLKRKQGAFVTLKNRGRLRGCIGTILPRMPLYQAVIKNAQNAALHDRRFRQVTVGELADIEVEISALSVPRKVSSYRDIVIGKHGIILRRGHGSATYLPHVAPEQKWDRPTTLSHLSRKAGLPTDGWKDPKTVFHVYTAEVWSEKGGH
jgi:AmmeMemoRadiSam system protein A